MSVRCTRNVPARGRPTTHQTSNASAAGLLCRLGASTDIATSIRRDLQMGARAVRLLISLLCVGAAGSGFAQQDYPNRPIRYIVPYAPGGSTSWTSRLVGQRL